MDRWEEDRRVSENRKCNRQKPWKKQQKVPGTVREHEAAVGEGSGRRRGWWAGL